MSHRSREVQKGLISPKLDPESDKVFFGKDYPDNLQPQGQLKPEFGHPYPAVQDTNHYEKDYIKDENSDDGEWKAQMDYDLLRTKMNKDRDELQKAKTAESELKEQLEKARAEEAAAAKRAEEAAARTAKARAEAKKAQEEAAAAKAEAKATEKAAEKQTAEEQHEASEHSSGEKQTSKTQVESHQQKTEKVAEQKAAAAKSTDNSKVEEATAKVEKEMSDLEKCEKELADAKARVKQLMEKEDELARKRRQQQEQEKAMRDAELARLAQEESAAASALSESEEETSKRREEEQLHKDTLAKQETAHQVAEKQYKHEASDLDKMENDLKAAEQHLKNFRHDDDARGGPGGVSNKEKPAGRTNMLGSRRSGAPQQRICIFLAAVLVALFIM